MHLDHVVLWVEDPLRSVDFYERIVGLRGVRVDEFREGKAPFPSVRISEHAVLDLMSTKMAPVLNGIAKGTPAAESAGHPVHHVCVAMTEAEYTALKARLDAAGVSTAFTMENSFGAQGHAPRAFYFADPDGNVLEARHYQRSQ
jgi:catechol 2,3-dioxygenase-like lactoylglutathione lyase family enzyme